MVDPLSFIVAGSVTFVLAGAVVDSRITIVSWLVFLGVVDAYAIYLVATSQLDRIPFPFVILSLTVATFVFFATTDELGEPGGLGVLAVFLAAVYALYAVGTWMFSAFSFQDWLLLLVSVGVILLGTALFCEEEHVRVAMLAVGFLLVGPSAVGLAYLTATVAVGSIGPMVSLALLLGGAVVVTWGRALRKEDVQDAGCTAISAGLIYSCYLVIDLLVVVAIEPGLGFALAAIPLVIAASWGGVAYRAAGRQFWAVARLAPSLESLRTKAALHDVAWLFHVSANVALGFSEGVALISLAGVSMPFVGPIQTVAVAVIGTALFALSAPILKMFLSPTVILHTIFFIVIGLGHLVGGGAFWWMIAIGFVIPAYSMAAANSPVGYVFVAGLGMGFNAWGMIEMVLSGLEVAYAALALGLALVIAALLWRNAHKHLAERADRGLAAALSIWLHSYIVAIVAAAILSRFRESLVLFLVALGTAFFVWYSLGRMFPYDRLRLSEEPD